MTTICSLNDTNMRNSCTLINQCKVDMEAAVNNLKLGIPVKLGNSLLQRLLCIDPIIANFPDEEFGTFANRAIISLEEKIVFDLNYSICNLNTDSPRTGKSLMHFLLPKGKIDIISKLVAEGANINSIDNEGNSPLHIALAQNDDGVTLDQISKWLELGANPYPINRLGKSPLDYWQRDGNLRPLADYWKAENANKISSATSIIVKATIPTLPALCTTLTNTYPTDPFTINFIRKFISECNKKKTANTKWLEAFLRSAGLPVEDCESFALMAGYLNLTTPTKLAQEILDGVNLNILFPSLNNDNAMLVKKALYPLIVDLRNTDGHDTLLPTTNPHTPIKQRRQANMNRVDYTRNDNSNKDTVSSRIRFSVPPSPWETDTSMDGSTTSSHDPCDAISNDAIDTTNNSM